MEDIIKQIQKHQKVADQLEISHGKRKELLDALADYTNAYIDNLPNVKSFTTKQPDKEKLEIDNRPHTMKEILSIFDQEVNQTGIVASSGGHVGYIPGGGIYAGALGDFLAAVSNEYAGVSYASPGAVEIENQVLNWLKKVFHFPVSSVGNLTSGGSMANMIALTAARDKHGVKNEKIKKSVIYLSAQVHHSVNKALRIIGLEDVIVRKLKLDDRYRIDVQNLKAQIKDDKTRGFHPFLVIASAGTTDVGSVDPLDEIADITEENGMWFHVDAAYGGFFILTSKKDVFKGIERADSLVIDPHKGLFLPYGLGSVLIKDAEAVLHSNHYVANYMQDAVVDDLVQDPANVSPELTKHFRGLRLWMALQLHGIEPFVAALEEKLVLTTYFRKRLQEIGCNVGFTPDLSVSYFWCPFEENENEKNRQLMDFIHEDGEVFLSSTQLDGQFVIRMAILSFRTKKTTIDKAVAMVERGIKSVLSN